VSTGFAILAIWLFGSVCFFVGAWWATRPKDHLEPDEDELESRSVAAGCSSPRPEATGAHGVKSVEKGQCETLLADPTEPPTLEELLDQFERIFSPQLVKERHRKG
jgi:hypothetical protein